MRRVEGEMPDAAFDTHAGARTRPPSRSARQFQRAAEGAAVELVSLPFRLLDTLAASGRAEERSRPTDPDDETELSRRARGNEVFTIIAVSQVS
jgi:hypothetical protein